MSNLGDVLRQVTCIPSAIPDNWSFRKLTDVCSPKQWRTVSSSEMTESGYPVFGANGFVGFYPEYNHADETIAITCRGNTCGTINRIPPKTYITGNSMALDNVQSEVISQNYLYYALKYRGVGDSISGSAQPQITGAGLRAVEFPAPPLPEQKKIATILSSVDEVIEKTRAQINKLKDLKTGMMQELLTKGIGHTEFKDSPVGRIPASWEIFSLGEVCDLQVGYAFKSAWFSDRGTKLLRGDNVGFGNLTWERTRYLTEEKVERFRDYLLNTGDLIIGMDRTFTKRGTKLSKLKHSDTPALLVQRVGRFLPHRIQKNFLWHLVRSTRFIDALKNEEKGMDIPHLSKSEILTPLIALPPTNEQQKIAIALTSVDNVLEKKEMKLYRANNMKQALMQDLLTGKVRVKVDTRELAEA